MGRPCPNSCGKHLVADLGFFGKIARNGGHPYPAYNVVCGAVIGEDRTKFAKKVAEISAFYMPKFSAKLLKAWIDAKDNYEDFANWIEADGGEFVTKIALEFKEIPSFEDDKNPYFDYTSSEIFSLKGRGSGECSAGMYDLIEADKKALSEALNEPTDEANLKKIRLLATRMLLVTKGEEARDEVQSVKAFKKLFIDSGLIDAKFNAVLDGGLNEGLKELAQAVIELYATMDNTLKFAKEKNCEAKIDEPKKVHVEDGVKFKDYTGVACPMNFVKTKMDLATMKSGDILEILLDDGAPIENVPKSVASEGHTVLSESKDGKIWRVRIKKK